MNVTDTPTYYGTGLLSRHSALRHSAVRITTPRIKTLSIRIRKCENHHGISF